MIDLMKFLPSFFSREPQIDSHFVALDIGTDSAKVGIFELGDDGRAHLIGFGKEGHGVGEILAGEIIDIETVAETVSTALHTATEMAGVSPELTVVGLSGSPCTGFTTVVRLTRSKPDHLLSEKELALIQEKVESASYERAQEKLAEELGTAKFPVDVVSSKVTSFMIDEHSVAEPLGKMGSTVDIYNFAAYCASSHLTSVHALLASLKLRFVTAASVMYTLVESLAATESSDFNAIVVDIGGDTTDVAVVFQGGIVGVHSFGVGGRSLTRAIATHMELDLPEAEEVKRAMVQGTADDDTVRFVKEALAPALDVWISGLSMTLREFSAIKKFPGILYMTGGGSMLPQIKEALIANPWARSLPFISFPKIRMVGGKDIRYIIDRTDGARTADDLASMSLGLVGLHIGKHKS